MGGEGCQDFVLLALRDLEEVQGPTEFRCDLIEFCGGDLEASVGLLKSERRRAGLGGRIREGSTRNVANPKRSHELEAGQPSQIFGVPFRQPRVLGLLPDDGVLHDGIAEVIDHRRDGEDTAQPPYRLFSGAACFDWAFALSARPNIVTGAAVSASPALRFALS